MERIVEKLREVLETFQQVFRDMEREIQKILMFRSLMTQSRNLMTQIQNVSILDNSSSEMNRQLQDVQLNSLASLVCVIGNETRDVASYSSFLLPDLLTQWSHYKQILEDLNAHSLDPSRQNKNVSKRIIKDLQRIQLKTANIPQNLRRSVDGAYDTIISFYDEVEEFLNEDLLLSEEQDLQRNLD